MTYTMRPAILDALKAAAEAQREARDALDLAAAVVLAQEVIRLSHAIERLVGATDELSQISLEAAVKHLTRNRS